MRRGSILLVGGLVAAAVYIVGNPPFTTLFASNVRGYEDPRAVFYGRAVDGSGHAVANATVSVRGNYNNKLGLHWDNMPSVKPYTFKTDENGRFTVTASISSMQMLSIVKGNVAWYPPYSAAGFYSSIHLCRMPVSRHSKPIEAGRFLSSSLQRDSHVGPVGAPNGPYKISSCLGKKA